MEKILFDWYEELKEKNVPVTPKMIKKKALEIKKFPDFIASKGWLEKFKRKFKLELSRESKCENSSFFINNVCEKKNITINGNCNNQSKQICNENSKDKTIFIKTSSFKPFQTIEVYSKSN